MTKKRLCIIAKTIVTCFLLFAIPTGVRSQSAEHSRLASGQWWKAAITATGLYKITVADLGALSGVPTDSIGLYGSCGGPLDKTNGNPRPDDLEGMAIQIADQNGNGLFDGNDYLLFYASAPSPWRYDDARGQYLHSTHPYASSNYVYLTLSGGPHKRIATVEAPTPTGADLTSCQVVALHEQELTNTHQSGTIWVGERFSGSNTSRTFTLTLPAAATGNVRMRYALASVSSGASAFTVDINGERHRHTFHAAIPYSTFYTTAAVSGRTVTVTIDYEYSESFAAGYLDYIEVDAEAAPSCDGTPVLLHFPAGDNGVHRCTVAGSATEIWDVTDYGNCRALTVSTVSGGKAVNVSSDSSRILLAFTPSAASIPASIESLANQDLHGSANPDMVIVAHPTFLEQAQRLASLHSIHDEMEVLVTTPEQVYNEFSSGQQDPIAIRELLCHYYRRHQADATLAAPRYLLLFGKGCYDNRDITGHQLPTVVTYQSDASFDSEGTSYCSDDIFAYLEEGESGLSSESMEVAIGRLPAKSGDEATHLVDKIERYMTRSDLLREDIRGDWRNSVALLADDADPGSTYDTTFTRSSEITANQIAAAYPQFNIDKIYADSYIQQSGADGSFYPDAKNALKKRIEYGCLLLNYIGHGSAQYIGTERYMEKGDISNYGNLHQLPFFITSTCTFGKYDMAEGTCGAEEFLLADGAGVGCLAASRPISHVQVVNTEMVMQALDPANRMGDAMKEAKNRYAASHALTLMGDPALRLSFPKYKVAVTAINGRAVDSLRLDSALVLSTVTVEGEIRDASGALVEDFDGVIYPEVYDRPVSTATLANDNEGCEVAFTKQQNLLYKGRDSVSGGRFRYQFIIPRDVAYQFGPCKLSHYAKSATEDATGAYSNLMLGGFDEEVVITESRPEIQLYLNDTNFREGGLCDPNPTLLATLFDSIGINAVGSGLGHDITACLDGNNNALLILNDFYETDITDTRRGTIRYNLSGLRAGRHTLTLKAWNIYNFSNSATLHFYVHGSDTATTSSLTAYPNPTSTEAWLRMEHNLKGSIATAYIDIYDMRGKLMTTLAPPVVSDSYVIGPVKWDLRSNGGQRVPPGIYLTRCRITTADGEQLLERGKIVVQ